MNLLTNLSEINNKGAMDGVDKDLKKIESVAKSMRKRKNRFACFFFIIDGELIVKGDLGTDLFKNQSFQRVRLSYLNNKQCGIKTLI